MKTVEELRQYCDQTLIPTLQPLESKRKRILYVTFFMLLIFLIIVIPISSLLYAASPSLHPVSVLSLAAWSILVLVVYGIMKRGYVKGFKSAVMEKLVKFIDPNLTYIPGQWIPRMRFDESSIFTKRADVYSGEDYVSGMVGKTRVEFSEIHAQERIETRDSKGRRRVEYSTIFKGLFFIADFNKNFRTRTFVLPDTATRMFGSVLGGALQSWNKDHGNLVKLEDPEFEKFFVVYGQDQIEARYILSPHMMEHITEYKKKIGKPIYISFTGNTVIMAISSSENLFEPRVLSTLLKKEEIEKYYEQLQFALGIVDELNLNTRIYGKE